MNRLGIPIKQDRGFTILEVVIVMVLIGILASIFAETINSSMEIYSDQVQRKDTHNDARRSFDFLAHSLREWTDWQTAPTGSTIDFHRYSRFESNTGQIYYDVLREGYTVSQQGLYYRRDDQDWANYYVLISSGISPSGSLFTTSVLGGKTRIVTNLDMTFAGKPFKMRMTVFPRSQGG